MFVVIGPQAESASKPTEYIRFNLVTGVGLKQVGVGVGVDVCVDVCVGVAV